MTQKSKTTSDVEAILLEKLQAASPQETPDLLRLLIQEREKQSSTSTIQELTAFVSHLKDLLLAQAAATETMEVLRPLCVRWTQEHSLEQIPFHTGLKRPKRPRAFPGVPFPPPSQLTGS